MKVTQTQATLLLALLTVGVVYYTFGKAGSAVASGVGKIVDGVGDAAQAVNPFNDQNVFYKSVNAAGASVSGNQNFNLGGFIFEAEQSTGVKPWQVVNPANAIGTAIGTGIKKLFGSDDTSTRGVTGSW